MCGKQFGHNNCHFNLGNISFVSIQKRYAHSYTYVHSLCNSRLLKLISKQMTSRHKDSDVNKSQQLKRKKKIIMGLSCNIFLHSGQKTLILGGRPSPNSYDKVEVRKFAKNCASTLTCLMNMHVRTCKVVEVLFLTAGLR